MNTTERVIREQFPFWDRAPVPPALTDAAATHVVVGCGTSFHLAQAIAAAFNLRGLRAIAAPGGDWARRRRAYLPDGAVADVIALSRSGESTETIQALEESRARGFATVGVTCQAGSGVTRAADRTVLLPTHPDEGIVMTASASLMVQAGLRLAGVTVGTEAATAARALMEALDARLPAALRDRSHFVYLGAGPLYGIAAEGAIKVQEMSLSYAQAYHTMEYRHGPVSLIDRRSLVTLLYHPDTRDEEARVARELRDKGALVLGLGGPGDVELPVDADPALLPLVVLPALQMLGERAAEAKGLDTGAPRYLNKVVVL